uniref:Uncharacterized protein n=1 Tax=Oryza punctata TaxID=4537 RepID=A0A0E0JIB8_ORYPU
MTRLQETLHQMHEQHQAYEAAIQAKNVASAKQATASTTMAVVMKATSAAQTSTKAVQPSSMPHARAQVTTNQVEMVPARVPVAPTQSERLIQAPMLHASTDARPSRRNSKLFFSN